MPGGIPLLLEENMTTLNPTVFKSDAEQLAALRVPFPISEIRTREQGGATLHYFEAYVIQQRLLDVLGTGLSIKTVQVIADDSNVNVETILEIEWASGKKTVTSGWGSADILISKNGKVVNDPYKAAATDSIKVAASKLGVAGELYDSKYREELKARLEQLEKEEGEKSFLTCQECGGVINSGTIKKKDGSPLDLTANQVATSTRKKFGRRLCIGCAEALRDSQ
jgi:hypothetical protein